MRRTALERFLKYVSKSDGCWTWVGGLTKDGYGRFRYEARAQLSHRVSYKLHIGELSDDIQVLHKCDNPSCVNPDHFFLGSQLDNIQDMVTKGRHSCPRGIRHHKAKLNPERVFEIRWLSAMGYSRRNLAAKYNVTYQNIRFIAQNKTWQMECHD